MPKYSVSVRVTDYYSVEVEAENFEEAEAAAELMEFPGEGAVHESGGDLEITSVTNLETGKSRLFTDGIMEEDDG